ncbi:uncharacterized protein At2g34160-like [Olea europaea subsp. europaea]|uniref:Uncharacterized protein At2g34160-like n=1 Tax=Olea europaea subsp. europaea TaxID=158383 RepID=A0A8S0PD92_OLEEU|nr:uncharacterized protein At2g34160-like [Olea europaea subsp. europaea]
MFGVTLNKRRCGRVLEITNDQEEKAKLSVEDIKDPINMVEVVASNVNELKSLDVLVIRCASGSCEINVGFFYIFGKGKMTMETDAVKQINRENLKKNKIQVSNTKKPLFFYVNLAKRYLQQNTEIELSALGLAITTVVTIAEILKNSGFANAKKILTSTVRMKDEAKGRLVQKARIEIVLEKGEKFETLMNQRPAAVQEATENGKVENKQ